jgi:hypothetical protein
LGRKKQYKGPQQLVICFFAPLPQNSPLAAAPHSTISRI